MDKLKAAWIGFRQPDRDPWEVYEEYAKIGYKALDMDISMMPGDPNENWARLKDLGLTVLTTHMGFRNTHKDVATKTVVNS